MEKLKGNLVKGVIEEYTPAPRRIAKFEKVSYEQFKKDIIAIGCTYDEKTMRKLYDEIKLPTRATAQSAGYDFYAPVPFLINTKTGIVIPTGIKCKMEIGWVMKIYPRSGLGFKYGAYLYNTTGIIDGDYYNSAENEGHIKIKLSAREEFDSNNNPPIVERGKGFCQAIFCEYGITVDDDVTEIRTGGFGSTTNK